MVAAMDKVEQDVKVSVAARMCGVPRRTLDDRIKVACLMALGLPLF